jgi:hypothetical protein
LSQIVVGKKLTGQTSLSTTMFTASHNSDEWTNFLIATCATTDNILPSATWRVNKTTAEGNPIKINLVLKQTKFID